MRMPIVSLLLFFLCQVDCPAGELLPLRVHSPAYRFNSSPVNVHASFLSSSPQWFVPGYGYQVPAVAYRRASDVGLSVYRRHSHFGNRRSDVFYGANDRFWNSPNALPWHLPGATTGFVSDSKRFDW